MTKNSDAFIVDIIFHFRFFVVGVHMRQLLVATDFSARSDRAIRRASLIAHETGASLSLVHVVDSDRPDYLVSIDKEAAEKALVELSQTIRDIDGIACSHGVSLDNPFEGIVAFARLTQPDLLVIGSHRRQILRDAFMGTTAERVIRYSPMPVLMANGMPTGPYRHVMAATDLSAPSARAVGIMARLELASHAKLSLVRTIGIPEVGLMMRAPASLQDIERHIEARKAAATEDLRAFARTLPLAPHHVEVQAEGGTTAATILQAAAASNVDLLVIGTRGQSGLSRLLLGSVAAAVLQAATIDVLVVPPSEQGTAP
ncbi:universal stress protein [Phreatobacter sp. HK31-P]